MVLGIDLAKKVVWLYGIDDKGFVNLLKLMSLQGKRVTRLRYPCSLGNPLQAYNFSPKLNMKYSHAV